MHEELSALVGVLAALAVGAMSPGPSFVMVARTAVATSRAHGLAAALGMGAGGVLFALAALAGLQAVLLAVPALYLVLKVAGGAYLAYLGWRIWRGARAPLDMSASSTPAHSSWRRALALGFVTQVSNPKTAIVYASVFAAFLPPAPSLVFDVALVGVVFLIEAGWYAVVALVLSSAGPRQAYLRFKAGVDRAAGGVMMALGLKLMWSAQRP